MTSMIRLKEFGHRFWDNYSDPVLVCLLCSIFMVLTNVLRSIIGYEWILLQHPIDIHPELRTNLIDWLVNAEFLVILVSLPINLLTYYAITNDRLTLPIRLLATSEHLNKIICALPYLFMETCHPQDGPSFVSPNFRIATLKIGCSTNMTTTFYNIYEFTQNYNLSAVVKNFQLLISMSRFLAISFGGLYFRYALKWPLLQLFLPYIYEIGLHEFQTLIDPLDQNLTTLYFYYIYPFPMFLMCSLDIVTKINMKRMLSSSSLITGEYISYFLFMILATFFLGLNLDLVLAEVLALLDYFLFFLVTSLISLVCFRKQKEKLIKPIESIGTKSTRATNGSLKVGGLSSKA